MAGQRTLGENANALSPECTELESRGSKAGPLSGASPAPKMFLFTKIWLVLRLVLYMTKDYKRYTDGELSPQSMSLRITHFTRLL